MSWTHAQLANSEPSGLPLTVDLTQDPHSLYLPDFFGNRLIKPQSISFVDPRIADAATIMAGLQSDIKVFLDPTRDGIIQITEALKPYQN
jgi:Domain of unknown function (DUF4347)